MGDLNIRKTGRAGRITFARPQALNALSHQMALDLHAALNDWRDDPQVAVVIIDAEGDRAFCAGGDIAAVYRAGLEGNHRVGRDFFRDEYLMNAAIADYPSRFWPSCKALSWVAALGWVAMPRIVSLVIPARSPCRNRASA